MQVNRASTVSMSFSRKELTKGAVIQIHQRAQKSPIISDRLAKRVASAIDWCERVPKNLSGKLAGILNGLNEANERWFAAKMRHNNSNNEISKLF